MRRALVCLNFCGCEAVWHKLKNTLKTPKMHFLPVFELMSGSLTATKVETYQCPLHQSILLTQGPIHENFIKKYWELAELENEIFLRRPFWIFMSAILNFFFCFISLKNAAHFYEGSFFSALWMVFPESWKRSCPNFYAHDCTMFFPKF